MDDKVIYLTFDDGPLEPYTSQIVDILGQFQAKATFFVCGKNIERDPAVVRKIVQAGHAIGNHTYSHSLVKTLMGNLLGEINQTTALIKQHTGVDTKLYRSPWGITLPWLRAALLARNYRIYHWNIMAFDWRQPSPEFIARHIIGRAFAGAIVLLHSGDQTGTGSRENTVKALPAILGELGRQGYRFGALEGSYNNEQGKWRNMAKDILLEILGR